MEPPCDLDTIILRNDCIEELLANEELFINVDSILKRFVDIDATISQLVQVAKF